MGSCCCRVTVDLCWHRGGVGGALTRDAMQCMATGREEDDEADGRGLGVSGRERGEGKGADKARPKLGRDAAGPARAEERNERGGGSGLLLQAKRERGERLGPSGFIHFYFHFVFPSLSMHIFK